MSQPVALHHRGDYGVDNGGPTLALILGSRDLRIFYSTGEVPKSLLDFDVTNDGDGDGDGEDSGSEYSP